MFTQTPVQQSNESSDSTSHPSKVSGPTLSPVTLEDMARVMREERKRKGLTQIDVAKALGVSQSALSKMENAKGEPTALHWFRFCHLTGIRLDCLMPQNASAA